MLKAKALETCRAKNQQSCDFENLSFVPGHSEQDWGRVYSQLTHSMPQPHGTSTLCSQMQEGTEAHLGITAHERRPTASVNSCCLSWTCTTAVNTQNLLHFLVEYCCNGITKKRKITYSSFPASLDAYFVYHRATLNPMETSSNTASCWALKKETKNPQTFCSDKLSLLIGHIA